MNCKQACDDIALYVGNDLSEKETKRLERHLDKCPECQKHYQTMKNSLQILQDSGDQLLVKSLHDSVWPDVSVKLTRIREEKTKFNGWIPATAVLAASLVVLLVSDVPTPDSNPAPSMPASTNYSAFNSNPLSVGGISDFIPASEIKGKAASRKKKNEKDRSINSIDSEDQFLNFISAPGK